MLRFGGGGWSKGCGQRSLLWEEGGTVVDHEFEEAVGRTGREVGEEGRAAGSGEGAGGHLVPLFILHNLYNNH